MIRGIRVRFANLWFQQSRQLRVECTPLMHNLSKRSCRRKENRVWRPQPSPDVYSNIDLKRQTFRPLISSPIYRLPLPACVQPFTRTNGRVSRPATDLVRKVHRGYEYISHLCGETGEGTSTQVMALFRLGRGSSGVKRPPVRQTHAA